MRRSVEQRRSTGGFTLVEVLIALLVLALALTAWQLRIAAQLDNFGYLRDKLLANWVAQEQWQYLRLVEGGTEESAALPLVESGSVVLDGQTWYWHLQPTGEVAATQSGTSSLEQVLQPVRLSVALTAAGALQAPLATIEGLAHAR